MFLWEHLQASPLPVILYGMGNGADKIFAICAEYNITITAVMVSDDHVRDEYFHGLPLCGVSKICEQYDNANILLAFGVYQDEILQLIDSLSERYQFYAPDLPLTGGPLLSPEYIALHQTEISKARELLCDQKSIECFDAILQNKLDGTLPPLKQIESARDDDMQLLALGAQEDYLDLGAYTGDTIEEFLSAVSGHYNSITALEPDAHNFRKLQKNTSALPRTTLYPYASWNESAELTFTGKGGRNAAKLPDVPGRFVHLHPVQAIPVDSLGKSFSFIKFDVEGAENESLLGMQETLRKSHPKLMVSVYHRTDDFFRIPLLIEKLAPGYRMYMRKNRCLPAWEIQLYCV